MVNRRKVLMGGASSIVMVSAQPLFSIPAMASIIPTETGSDWWREWVSGFDAIPSDELSSFYQDMVRNCSPEQITIIEAPGPVVLSEDWFYRCRQYAYRRMIYVRHGVVYADKPGDIMHHPV